MSQKEINTHNQIIGGKHQEIAEIEHREYLN